MCLKIGLKSEAILIVSGFLAKNYFLQRNGRRERIWFSTAMNRRAMISADKFNEPAPVRALRPDLSTLHTIAKPGTLTTTTRGESPGWVEIR